MNKKNDLWPLDEFVSFELKEDSQKNEFIIILKGKLKYSDLISIKVGDIKISQQDVDDFLT